MGVSSSASPAGVAAARRGVLDLSQVMGCRLLVAASMRRRPKVSDLAVAGSADLACWLRPAVRLVVVRGDGAAAAHEVLGAVGLHAGGAGVPPSSSGNVRVRR